MSIDVRDLPLPGEFANWQQARDAQLASQLRARRRRLLLWSAPAVVILLLFALKLLSGAAIAWSGIHAFNQQSHATAASRFNWLHLGNVVERWKPHYNEGTAVYAGGDFFAASELLETALELVPSNEEQPTEAECLVRLNLSLSYEGLGDEAAASGASANAIEHYQRAQDAIAMCGSSGGEDSSESEQATDDASERQGEKREEQEQQSGDGDGEPQEGDSEADGPDGESEGEGSDPQDGESEDEQSEPEPTTDPQQQELEDRNAEAEAERQQRQDSEGGGAGSGQSW